MLMPRQPSSTLKRRFASESIAHPEERDSHKVSTSDNLAIRTSTRYSWCEPATELTISGKLPAVLARHNGRF